MKILRPVFFIGWDNKNTPKILEDIEHLPDIRWDILDRHFQRKDLFKTDYVRDYITMMENKMINDEQKYLHLGIEVRPYLWT